MANIITGFRVLISIARQTNTVSGFGVRFDTAADFVFVVVCLIKLLPVVSMPIWLWVWIVMIALTKIVNIISGYIVQRTLAVVHSVMNKVTGVMLFILPLTFSIIPLTYSAIPVCAVATFAAIQEGHFIRSRKE